MLPIAIMFILILVPILQIKTEEIDTNVPQAENHFTSEAWGANSY